MRIKRLRLVGIVISMVAAIGITTAFVAAADNPKERPISGTVEGQFGAAGEPWTGTMIVSHLGKGEVNGSLFGPPRHAETAAEYAQFEGMDCVLAFLLQESGGFENYTAANGDELHKEIGPSAENWRLCINGDGQWIIGATHRIVGGTGRFQGASGEIDVSGTLQASTSPDGHFETFEYSMDGVVSY